MTLLNVSGHQWLPLEQHFFDRQSSADAAEVPDHRVQYGTHYQTILNLLNTNVYPVIDLGLTAYSDGIGRVYTLHNKDHFDEVVKYAGQLLGLRGNKNAQPLVTLSTYELFVLLLAIRIHDAGNAFGRELHEAKCDEVLNVVAKDILNSVDRRSIADIAGAHGGHHKNGDKDTIGYLAPVEDVGATSVRFQAIAAIVRFADEICESRTRAASLFLSQNKLPEENEVFHAYANSIHAVKMDVEAPCVNLTFVLRKEDIDRQWGMSPAEAGKPIRKKFLIDYILDRLAKMNRERIYYNRFVDPLIRVQRIKAQIRLVDANDHMIYEETITIRDDGYPDGPNTDRWRSKYHSLEGDSLAKKFAI